MSFVSTEFLLLLLVTYIGFVVAPAYARFYILLLASYLFYAYWSIPFLALLITTTTIDYAASLVIKNTENQRKKKIALFSAIGSNLLILVFFKYFNFLALITASLAAFFHFQTLNVPNPEISLPLGISYFTFEAISYTVDVYRGKKPAKNWLHYNFYIMYFPHLVAGPIVRFEDFSAQYRHPIELPSIRRVSKAFELIILGYLFKSLIADPMGTIAAPLFENPQPYSSLSCLTAALQFCCCLYFDFLAYTHIARGVSLLFNLQLPTNFKHPLNASNISNFWQRWQISLSRWLHDYIYQPLGGRTRIVQKRMAVAFLTLFVAGVWHGAGWNFIALGFFYGSAVAFYHGYRAIRKNIFGNSEKEICSSLAYNLLSIAITFFVVVLSSVLFREPNINYALQIIGKILRVNAILKDIASNWLAANYSVILIPTLCVLLLQTGPLWEKLYYKTFDVLPYWLRVQIGTVTLIGCWVLNAEAAKTFIYFRF